MFLRLSITFLIWNCVIRALHTCCWFGYLKGRFRDMSRSMSSIHARRVDAEKNQLARIERAIQDLERQISEVERKQRLPNVIPTERNRLIQEKEQLHSSLFFEQRQHAEKLKKIADLEQEGRPLVDLSQPFVDTSMSGFQRPQRPYVDRSMSGFQRLPGQVSRARTNRHVSI